MHEYLSFITISRIQLAILATVLLPVAPLQAQTAPAQQPKAAVTADARTSRPAAIVPIVLLRRSAKPAPDKSDEDVLVPATPGRDPIAADTARILGDPAGYGQMVLRLNQRARAYLLRDPALPQARRAALAEPACLFLSDRQGGFPVESFWLEKPDGTLERKEGVQFVDTVVGERDLQPGNIGGLEAIYAHELGHLMMASLAGPPTGKATTAVHFVTVKTDGWNAFTEGWGEHFQPMALDHYRDAPWQAHRADPAPSSERYLVQPVCPGRDRRMLDLPGELPVPLVAWHARAAPP